jgi:hypothetical protein
MVGAIPFRSTVFTKLIIKGSLDTKIGERFINGRPIGNYEEVDFMRELRALRYLVRRLGLKHSADALPGLDNQRYRIVNTVSTSRIYNDTIQKKTESSPVRT